MDKYKKYVDPVREKISSLNDQILKSKQESQLPDTVEFPNTYEVEAFARDSGEIIKNLNFERKQAIVRTIVDRAVGNKEIIQVSGFISVPESYGWIPPSVGTPNLSPFLLNNINLCAKYRYGVGAIRPQKEGIPFRLFIQLPPPKKLFGNS